MLHAAKHNNKTNLSYQICQKVFRSYVWSR